MLNLYKELEIDITSVCNLDCPLCFRNSSSFDKTKSSIINIDSFRNLFNLFPNLDIISFGFLISEPTTHPEFLEMVKYTKSLGKNVVISTNGNLKDEKYWKELGSLLNKNDRIFWPIDGSTQEIYQKYRAGGNLERVLKNQQACISTSPETEHITQFIEFKHNMDDDIQKIKDMTPGTTFQSIACCGDCAENSSEVQPRWNYQLYKNLKKMDIQSSSIECETKVEKIIFVSAEGIIGFCPSQLGSTLYNPNPITIYSSPERINDYIDLVYSSTGTNPICQFNCGKQAKKLKQKINLDVVTK